MRAILLAVAMSISGPGALAQDSLYSYERMNRPFYGCRWPTAETIAKEREKRIVFSQDDLRIRLWAMGIIPTMHFPPGTTLRVSDYPYKHYVVQMPLAPGDPYAKRCLMFNCSDGALTSDENWFYPPCGLDRAKKLPSQDELEKLRQGSTSSGLYRSLERRQNLVLGKTGHY